MAKASSTAAQTAAELAARQSYGKLVAYLAARSRDVASAEDALAEAFAAALEQWPKTGAPDNPEAWLLTVARRKQIDAARKHKRGEEAGPHLQLLAEDLTGAAGRDEHIPDRRLALMFTCAHPAIDPSVRTPLILQTVLGLDAAAIACAFLVSPATMSQRLVRAKTKIKEAGIPFRVPENGELSERLEAVLAAIYAAFTQGWSDARGTRDLANEAIFLGRLMAGLMPEEPEALGLAALMLFAQARQAARRDSNGGYIPLSDQDTSHWDRRMIGEAELLLRQASDDGRIGRYQLEAAVQSAHSARARTGRTNWSAIAALYDGLMTLTGSPVVAINRAIAIAETKGPKFGLAALAAVEGVTRYQPYWAAKASLLAEAGDPAAAELAYAQAIGLAADPAVRDFLQKKRQALRH